MPKEIHGTVADGVGEGRGFTQLGWVRDQFRTRLGFDPYPGTLNVRVQDASALDEWRTGPSISIEPGAPGFCASRCYPIRIGGIAAAWIVPEVAGYPRDLIEIMAPVSLRETLNLNTGDAVLIEFC